MDIQQIGITLIQNQIGGICINSREKQMLTRRIPELELLRDLLKRLCIEPHVTYLCIDSDYATSFGMLFHQHRIMNFMSDNVYKYWAIGPNGKRVLDLYVELERVHNDILKVLPEIPPLNFRLDFTTDDIQIAARMIPIYNVMYCDTMVLKKKPYLGQAGLVDDFALVFSDDSEKKKAGYFICLCAVIDILEYLATDRGPGQHRRTLTQFGTAKKWVEFILSMWQAPIMRFMKNPGMPASEIMQ